MKKEKYSEEFRAQALRKVYGRGRTIRSIADELNINHFTLKNWMKREPEGSREGAVIVEAAGLVIRGTVGRMTREQWIGGERTRTIP